MIENFREMQVREGQLSFSPLWLHVCGTSIKLAAPEIIDKMVRKKWDTESYISRQ